MTTQLEIYNAALVRLAKAPNLVNAATAAKQNANGQNLAAAWPIVLKAQLRRYPWNFARARAILAADTTAPDFGWSYRYLLPQSPRWARVWDIDDPRQRAWWPCGDTVRFIVEGGYLLTNRPGPLKVRGIAEILDATAFDGLFTEIMTIELAAFCCLTVTGSPELQQNLMKEGKLKLEEAQSIDSIEGDDEDADDPDEPGDLRSFRAANSG